MEKIIEMDRKIFGNNDERDDNKLLFIQEMQDGKPTWAIKATGWEYSIWTTLTIRGGLAEAEELVLLENSVEKTVSIEEYVALYRQVFKEHIPFEEFHNTFNIHASIRMKKAKDRAWDETLIRKTGLPILEDTDQVLSVAGDASDLEAFRKLPLWRGDAVKLTLTITEK